MEMKPGTPLPWIQGSGIKTNIFNDGGLRVVRADFDGDMESPEAQANAAYIVHACNGYASLESANAALAAKLEKAEEAQTVLDAWMRVFGTMQLTHAKDRLDAAEKKADALAEERDAALNQRNEAWKHRAEAWVKRDALAEQVRGLREALEFCFTNYETAAKSSGRYNGHHGPRMLEISKMLTVAQPPAAPLAQG